jgi:eukaryotic-like serine/threonine-protein kinase
VTDPLDLLRAALEGRYAAERLIGEGGMATVYLARDLRHDRPVAVKVLRSELAVSIGADRFLREIKLAAQLQHPNILALYDSGEAAGFLYYVMPFVKGESLRARLNREEQLSLPDAIGLTCEIAEALQCAHSQNIIHRDIKPENILLHEGHALVADFGIARAVTQAGGDKLTETGMAVGTPHYMSPEQALGAERVDGRADQYSLGCMLYEMLVGEPPFKGPNAMAILARHSMEVVPSLQVVRHSIPDEVEDAIMRALEKTPADRFPNVRDFADALAEVDLGALDRRTSSRSMRARRTTPNRTSGVRRRTGSGSAVEKPSLPSRILGFARAGRARFWIAAAALVLAIGGVLAWRIWLRPADASADTRGLSPNRIAVMYFQKTAGSSDSLGYLADGITEALINELSGVSNLEVISRNGVLPFKNAPVAPDSVAQVLKAGTLVEGTLAQAGERLRLTVSLINGSNGAQIGSKILDRPREEIFALQDDLAKEVAFFLRQQLGREIQLQASRVETRNTKAWELMQKALTEARGAEPLVAAGDTAAAARQYQRADSLLAQAEASDKSWVGPPTQRGWLAYRRARAAGVEKGPGDEWTRKGLEHAQRALQIQPTDPDALEVHAILIYWRWLLNLEPDATKSAQLLAEAEKELRASVAANPTQASAWTTLSHLLINKNETAEAKLAAMRAYESDPYLANANVTLWRLFSTSADLEDAIEANHWCEEGYRRFPKDSRFTECRLWVLFLKGQKPDIDKAWELHREFVELVPPDARQLEELRGRMIVAVVIARAAASSQNTGLRDSAEAVIARSRGDATVDPTRDLAQWEAIAQTILGNKDQAFRQLSIFIASNPQQRVSFDKEELWWFRDLRSDPRWAALAGASH